MPKYRVVYVATVEATRVAIVEAENENHAVAIVKDGGGMVVESDVHWEEAEIIKFVDVTPRLLQ